MRRRARTLDCFAYGSQRRRGEQLLKNFVTPQVRHPERVFLREGSSGSGSVLSSEILRAKRRAQDDVAGELQNFIIKINLLRTDSG